MFCGPNQTGTPDGRFRVRVSTDCTDAARYINSAGTIVLRLIHESDMVGLLQSRYDLVQVVPFWQCPCVQPEGEPESLSAADATHDGAVSEADVALFADGWVAGAPVADVNADGSVDLADIDAFEAALAGDGPE